jgi:hypothetical protein
MEGFSRWTGERRFVFAGQGGNSAKFSSPRSTVPDAVLENLTLLLPHRCYRQRCVSTILRLELSRHKFHLQRKCDRGIHARGNEGGEECDA